MENSNIIISHKDPSNISKGDLVSLLELCGKGYEYDNANISRSFLVGIVNIALVAYPESLGKMNVNKVLQ